MATMDKWERQHRREMSVLERLIKALYEETAQVAAIMGSTVDQQLTSVFSFTSIPSLRRRADELFETLHDNIQYAIIDGVKSQWTLANNKNDELARTVFGDSLPYLSLAQQRRYFSNNEEARDAFLARSRDGLSLSDRVWEYTKQYRREIELGLDVGIRAGESADELSRDLRSYLVNPDKLFRRVRDEHGNLVLSKAAKAYHPGQGVYRSSYQNARRLAATETNMAYRTADHDRYQDLDFVVGIEIHLSNNHTCKGVKGVYHDICDELEGKYPKDFKFTGWHPNCRCYVTTILKTRKEMRDDNRAIMNGQEPYSPKSSKNYVWSPPEAFFKWLDKNEERLKRATSVPYFMRDNKKYVGKYTLDLIGTEAIPVNMKDWLAKLRRGDIPRPAFGSVLDVDRLKDYDSMRPYLIELSRLAQKNGYKAVQYDVEWALRNESKVAARDVLRAHYEKVFRYEYGLPLVEFPKSYGSLSVYDDFFARLNAALPEGRKWFENGALKLHKGASGTNYGETDMRGNIWLSVKRTENFTEGFQNIANRRRIDYKQAQAMHTMWHEICHNRNKVGLIRANDREMFFAELSNEYSARRTSGEFYRSLGYKDVFPQIQAMPGSGYYYRTGMLELLVKEAKLDKDIVGKEVVRSAFNSSYRVQEFRLKDALVKGGLKKKDGSDITLSEINDLFELIFTDDARYQNGADYNRLKERFEEKLKELNIL